MDAVDLVESFATDTYVVSRRPHAQYVDGVAQPQDSTTFSIRASVQPASGRDLLRLPEGRRTIETRVLFTASVDLQDGAQGGLYEADQVLIEGDVWEVQNVEPWRPAPSSDVGYVKAIVQSMQAQAFG